jgi:hypothetical protein
VENAQYLLALSSGKQDHTAIAGVFTADGLQERA